MRHRRRIMVFVEHDIVARHFLLSGVFAPLADRHDLCFVLPATGDKRLTIDTEQLNLPGKVVRVAIDPQRQVLFKWLFYVRQLRWRPGTNYRALRKARRWTLGWKAAVMITFLGFPGITIVYRKLIERRLAKRPPHALEQAIARFAPDVLLHPSVLDGNFINDVIDQANARGIPSVIAMNSWDNPSSKNAAIGNPDWLLVWGPQSQAHAVEFMKMPIDRTVMFGAAQFDLFRNPPRIDREEFCKRHHADSAHPLVLYAGSSKGADEFGQLKEIDAAIDSGILPPLTVIYRPHPWGNAGKGGERFQSHCFRNVRIERSMQDYIDRISEGGNRMSLPDYRETHDLLSSVDAVISPLSTILIEALMHGKPALCQLPIDEAEAHHFRLTLPMVYVQELLNNPAFRVARGRRELLSEMAVLASAAVDPALPAKLKAASAYFVSSFERSWGERLSELIEDKIAPSEEVLMTIR